MVLTENDRKVLRLLAVSFAKYYSINNIAKVIGVAPNGAYKILKKFEKEGVLKAEHIANIKTHKLNFENEKTLRVLELAFMPKELEGKIKSRAGDLQRLKSLTKACIIFGSYITTKKEPGDLDILFILAKSQYPLYKTVLEKVQEIVPIKIQDVVQTVDDLQKNLKKEDPIIVEALCNGVILWGSGVLVKVIKNVHK